MIWDGECHFCRRWIERWREITAGEVEYAPYQEIADRFPEIPREQFQRSVVYIDKSGQVFVAAEAVYRSLRFRPSKKWLWWSYQHIPGFAAVSELGYNFIARHRGFASAITQLLWGKDVRPPTYFWAHRWFLRALGLVYLIAFVSLWIQIDGLVGSNGILPISDYLSLAHREIGYKTVWILPTLCWFNSSNGFLHFLCGSGVLFSLLLICRIAPAISLGVLFVSYLSLSVAGQAFLSFQWDILLLETGFRRYFFRALAALASISDCGYTTGLTGRDVSAQVSPLQAHVHVWGGETHQRRQLLGLDQSFLSLERTDRAGLSLLDPTAPDRLRLVRG